MWIVQYGIETSGSPMEQQSDNTCTIRCSPAVVSWSYRRQCQRDDKEETLESQLFHSSVALSISASLCVYRLISMSTSSFLGAQTPAVVIHSAGLFLVSCAYVMYIDYLGNLWVDSHPSESFPIDGLTCGSWIPACHP